MAARVVPQPDVTIIDTMTMLRLAARDPAATTVMAPVWFAEVVRRREAGLPPAIMDHTAMTFLLRKGLVTHENGYNLVESIEAELVLGWRRLAGIAPKRKNLLTTRLPEWVLRSGTPADRVYHLSSFHDMKESASARVLAPWLDYQPDAKDLATIFLVVLLLTSWRPAAEAAVGTAVGYFACTITEHLIHKYMGHMRRPRMFSPVPGFRRYLHGVRFNHMEVHHGGTRLNHTHRFANADIHDPSASSLQIARKDRMDARVVALGPDVADYVFGSDYGATLTQIWRNLLAAGAFAGACAIAMHPLTRWMGFDAGVLYFLAALSVSGLYVFASAWLHPYLHQTRGRAVAECGPAMRWFLGTRYASFIGRSHYRHHRGGGNYNLVWGGDWLLGDWYPLSLEGVLEMHAFDAIH